MPSWVRFFLIIVVLSLVGSFVAAVGQDFIVPLVFIVIAIFPGPSQKVPRLIRIAPYIFFLSLISTIILGAAKLDLFSLDVPELMSITWPEVVFTLISSGVLLWMIFYNDIRFKKTVCVVAISFIALELGVLIYNLTTDSLQKTTLLAWFSNFFAELFLCFYIIRKLPGERFVPIKDDEVQQLA